MEKCYISLNSYLTLAYGKFLLPFPRVRHIYRIHNLHPLGRRGAHEKTMMVKIIIIQDKIQPRTGHEGPDGEKNYGSTLA